MATAYLYSGAGTAEAPGLLVSKITAEIGVAPTDLQMPGSYIYVTFAASLGAGAKAMLDDFMLSRDGAFSATDSTPSAGIGGIARSPDTSYWKLTVTDPGAVVAVKIV